MTGDALKIRSARLADLIALADFLEPYVEDRELLPRSKDELRTLIRHGFVAEGSDGRIAGFAAIEIYSTKLAEVQAMAVSQQCRGQGVGTRLLEHCVARARAEGVLELMAITMSDDLFRSVGFDYALPNQKRALFLQTRTDP